MWVEQLEWANDGWTFFPPRIRLRPLHTIILHIRVACLSFDVICYVFICFDII